MSSLAGYAFLSSTWKLGGMRNEETNREIDQIELKLRNEYYRYKLALKDGAVDSILTEVIKTINLLEGQLQNLRSLDSRALGQSWTLMICAVQQMKPWQRESPLLPK